MGTIQRPVKTYGNRNYVAEVAAAPGNQDPILASEVDNDLDTIYTAWNGGADTVNIKDGAVTQPKLTTAQQSWSMTGSLALPGDATKSSLTLGSQTIKQRLQISNTAAWSALGINRDAQTGAQDDGTKTSWTCMLRSDTDQFSVARYAPGGASAGSLIMDSNAKVTLTGPMQRRAYAAAIYDGRGTKTYANGSTNAVEMPSTRADPTGAMAIGSSQLKSPPFNCLGYLEGYFQITGGNASIGLTLTLQYWTGSAWAELCRIAENLQVSMHIGLMTTFNANTQLTMSITNGTGATITVTFAQLSFTDLGANF